MLCPVYRPKRIVFTGVKKEVTSAGTLNLRLLGFDAMVSIGIHKIGVI